MRLLKITKLITWSVIQRIIVIIFGGIVTAISINSLILPNRIADGGVTGIAIIFHYLFNWPISWVVFFLNLPLFLLGLKMVGRTFLLYSILGVVSLSIALEFTTSIPSVTNDALLASIFGGVLSGVGMGLIFRSRGSLGGTDILAVFLSRTTPLSVGQVLLAIDAVIFIVTAILFKPEIAMYAIIYMFIATRVIDLVQEGVNNSKGVLVITKEPHKIAEEIMKNLERGVTFFHAMGAFTGEDKKVVYCVIRRTELSHIKDIIHKYDSRAFMAITDVPEVVGEGFSSWRGH